MKNKKLPQQTEDVILEYPYKVFGLLKVTKTRLIFTKFWPGFNTFAGIINISDLVEVSYIKGAPKFGVPGLELLYCLPNGQSSRVRVHFPSISTRLGLKLRSGITPEGVFETIMSLKERAQ